MSTRAIEFLQQRQIPHEVVKYDHQKKGAEFASRAVGVPLERTFKTLVVTLSGEEACLVLMPGHRQLDLKKLARACQVKKAALADGATAERLTGYLVGGISPFGTRRPFKVIVEETALQCKTVIINAGQRGTMLNMTPGDIVATLGCRPADIAAYP
jgi:Cys-tRNA(Pro)/Cys-tRNA(Cys) deacylase